MGVITINEGLRSSFDKVFEKRLKAMMVLMTMVMSFFLVAPKFVNADEGKELMDLFQTSAFSGSWEVFSKFNWLGALMNFVISAFCLIGIVLLVLRILITLLFKSHEVLWDRVYELKSGQKGSKFFGFPGMFKEVVGGNYGVGLDAAMGFLLSLLPDVKSYSDYNPEKMLYNLQEDDTITTYLLKISLPTIMAFFVFAIGFNGTLLQGFGNVASALAFGAKKLVTVDLASGVSKIMGAGSMYSFSFNTDDEFEKLQKNICQDIYFKVMPKLESLDSATMQEVGSSIQNKITNTVSEGFLNNLIPTTYGTTITKDHDFAKNFTYSTTINSATSGGGSKGHVVISFKDLNITGTDVEKYQVHVIVNLKDNVDNKLYFELETGKGPKSSAPPTLPPND